MIPVDKASRQQKVAAESEDDPRLDWEKEDREIDGSEPDLEQTELDHASL